MNVELMFAAASLCSPPIGMVMVDDQCNHSRSEYVQAVNDCFIEQMSSGSSSVENPNYTLGSSNKSIYFPYDLKRDFSYERLNLQKNFKSGISSMSVIKSVVLVILE